MKIEKLRITKETKGNKDYYYFSGTGSVKCCIVFDKFNKEYRLKIGHNRACLSPVVFDDFIDAFNFAMECVESSIV